MRDDVTLKNVLIFTSNQPLSEMIAAQLSHAEDINCFIFHMPSEAKLWAEENSFTLAIIESFAQAREVLNFALTIRQNPQNMEAQALILADHPETYESESIKDYNIAEVINKNTDITELCDLCTALTQTKKTDPSPSSASSDNLFTDETAELTNDGLWEWDISQNKMRFSSKWKALLGYRENELPDIPATFFGRVHPDDMRQLNLAIDTNLNSTNKTFSCEFRLRQRSGQYIWVQTRAYIKRDEKGHPNHIAASQRSVNDYKSIQEELSHNAFHDSLTGLPNRLLFTEQLKQAFLRFRRDHTHRFAVLFTDMDGFKQINDRLGHATGDELLKVLATRLRKAVREVDTVARLAGDEFTVLISDYEDITDVENTAHRILQEISAPMTLSQARIRPTISIGISYCRPEHTSPEEILSEADAALYEAKDRGKACYAVFKAKISSTQHLPKHDFEEKFRMGMKNGQVCMYYQPIYDLATRTVRGYEALVRWNSPDLGLVMPENLFAHIEGSEVVEELGRFAIFESTKALKKLQDFHNDPDMRMRINFSYAQLMIPTLIEDIKSALSNYGLKPQHVMFELQESTLKLCASRQNEALDELKELGVGLCLDDFGTGTSSIQILSEEHFEEIKLDRVITSSPVTQKPQSEFIRLMLLMQPALQAQIICENIESEAEFKSLVALSKNLWGQGFYLQAPCPLKDIIAENKSSPKSA